MAKECAVLSEVSLRCAFDRMPAYHVDDGKPYPHKSPSGSSGKCASIHEVWKWLPMERYSCMDMLSKCDVAPSKTIINPKVLSPIFVDPWSKKMSSPNSSALNPLTRDLSGLGFVENFSSEEGKPRWARHLSQAHQP